MIDALHCDRSARYLHITRLCRISGIGLGRGDRCGECRTWHKRCAKCECKGDLCAKAHLFVVCIRLHV